MANATTHEQTHTARDSGRTGQASSAAGAVADKAGDMMAGLTDSIRNNPMLCLAIGLGLGFVLARMFKR